MKARTTRWVMPDGTSRYETTEECPDCGHHHSPTWGGICVGCPCPNVRSEEASGNAALDVDKGER